MGGLELGRGLGVRPLDDVVVTGLTRAAAFPEKLPALRCLADITGSPGIAENMAARNVKLFSRIGKIL